MFKLRGISNPYGLLASHGLAHKTACNIAYTRIKTIRLEHLELICRLLNCSPNDVIRYEADERNILPANHALLKLQHEAETASITDMFKTMSLEQLQQLAAVFKQQTSS